MGSLATWATLCLRQLGRHWAAASGLVASTLSCHGLPWPAALGILLPSAFSCKTLGSVELSNSANAARFLGQTALPYL